MFEINLTSLALCVLMERIFICEHLPNWCFVFKKFIRNTKTVKHETKTDVTSNGAFIFLLSYIYVIIIIYIYII